MFRTSVNWQLIPQYITQCSYHLCKRKQCCTSSPHTRNILYRTPNILTVLLHLSSLSPKYTTSLWSHPKENLKHWNIINYRKNTCVAALMLVLHLSLELTSSGLLKSIILVAMLWHAVPCLLNLQCYHSIIFTDSYSLNLFVKSICSKLILKTKFCFLSENCKSSHVRVCSERSAVWKERCWVIQLLKGSQCKACTGRCCTTAWVWLKACGELSRGWTSSLSVDCKRHNLNTFYHYST